MRVFSAFERLKSVEKVENFIEKNENLVEKTEID